MIKSNPIVDQDILIGEYILGLLSPQETHRVQALLGRDPAAARTALRWEETFLTLVDALSPTQPPDTVLEQILTTLDLPLPPETEKTAFDATQSDIRSTEERKSDKTEHQSAQPQDQSFDAPVLEPVDHVINQAADQHEARQHAQASVTVAPTPPEPVSGHVAPAHERRRRSRRIWVGGAAAVMAMALLTLAFMPSQPAEPPIVILEVAPSKGAILLAPGQSSTPGWVVTIDPEHNATLTPQVHTETPPDASVQLWTYNKTLRQPRSLGLIDPNQPVAIPAELMGAIGDDQFFEMTLEPAGGSPTSEPTGPILFIGRVVTFS